jgi:Bacterial capsule synthesis protein PGA_cap
MAQLRFPLVLLSCLALGIVITACRGEPPTRAFSATATPLATRTPALTPTLSRMRASPTASIPPSPLPTVTPSLQPSPTLTPTPPPGLWLSPYLPGVLRNELTIPAGMVASTHAESASLRFEFGFDDTLVQWVYALVAPFPTLLDGVTTAELMDCWRGKCSGPFAGEPILMDEETLNILTAWWGVHDPQAVQVIPAGQLLDAAWDSPPAWAIIPFERIEPRWKVLEVDGQSPLRKDFDPQTYSLMIPFSLSGDDPALAEAARQAWASLPSSNRDPAKLTTVMVTGVTAMVRGTAWKMEKKGILYPAQDIRGWLREADILHISNEIPFYSDCPSPDPQYAGLIFCSSPRYIALLEDIGTDVVELTGDHFADYGAEATLFTLDLYHQEGWPYYGGGANIEEARQPVLFEHNGNKIAFLGCNAKGGGYATASETVPGAGECDFDYMRQEVQRLRLQGYLPIVTFQHQESENSELYRVRAEYRPDFQSMAEAGAVIVSGSQAHQPLNFEFTGDGLIHYGLGNLFFDQYRYYAPTTITDRAFLDRHVFYNGRYLGVELLTIQFTDLAHTRPATSAERLELLQAVFKGSGW